MKIYSHYFRANARYIIVARDEIGYAQYLSKYTGDLAISNILEEYLSEKDIEEIAFDDEDLLFFISCTDADITYASSLSKSSERPYALSRTFNVSFTFASRSGRTLNTVALNKIAEKLIVGIGQMLGALYVEYQLGVNAETNVQLLAYSADSKFEATDEEIVARRTKLMEDAINELVERLNGISMILDETD